MPPRRSARIREQRAATRVDTTRDETTRTRSTVQRPSTRGRAVRASTRDDTTRTRGSLRRGGRAIRAGRAVRTAAERPAPAVLRSLRGETELDNEFLNMLTDVSHIQPRISQSRRTQTGAQDQVQANSHSRSTGGRLSREMNEIMLHPTDGCQVEFVGDNIYNWLATILGPSDTPYEGGHFQLDIEFPENYPHAPPVVQFLTKIYHCNVTKCGLLCMDILSFKWSPVLTVDKVLLSIRSLLSDPNPNDAMDLDVAIMYKTDREKHDRIAREWTKRYATPESF